MTINRTIDGLPIHFERRRYGRQWYCWVHYRKAGQWKVAGDPFPKHSPTNEEIKSAIGGAEQGPEKRRESWL
jgi:hypothetical protein